MKTTSLTLEEQAEPARPGPIDWTRPVRLVGSKRPVRILAVVPEIQFGVAGLVEGRSEIDVWTYQGQLFADCPSKQDLENIPEPTYAAQAVDLEAIEFAHSRWEDGYIHIQAIGQAMRVIPALLAEVRGLRAALSKYEARNG